MISGLLTFPRTSRVEVETPVTGRHPASRAAAFHARLPKFFERGLRDMGKQND
jgi:hypothetical protein